MDDFSIDDLKQLFNVSHENEYIYLNIQLLKKMISCTDQVKGDANISSLCNELNSLNSGCLTKLTESIKVLDNYDNSKYSVPSVLNISCDSDDNKLIKLKELYNNYNKIVPLLNESLCKLTKNKLDHMEFVELLNTTSKKGLTLIMDQIQGNKSEEVQNISLDVKETKVEPKVEPEVEPEVESKVESKVDSPVNSTGSSPSIKLDCDSIMNANMEALKKFKLNCEKLESDKSVVATCIDNINDYKAKGLNVDGALGPLNEQMNAIQAKLDNYNKSVLEQLDKLNKEVNNFKSDIEN